MNLQKNSFMSLILAACFLASASSSIAQSSKLSASHKDVAYDDAHAAQKLDVYLPESDKPLPAMIYIHGGGWRAGSKNRVPGWLGGKLIFAEPTETGLNQLVEYTVDPSGCTWAHMVLTGKRILVKGDENLTSWSLP